MTLILGMIKDDGVYISTDYRVTDGRTGRPVDDAESKFLGFQFLPFETGPWGMLTYTGLARLRDGTKMSAWIRETLRGEVETFDESMAHLLSRLNRDVAPYRTALIVNVVVQDNSGRCLFGGLSNLEHQSGQAKLLLRPFFAYELHEIKDSFWFANGSGATSIRSRDWKLLRSQLRVKPRTTHDHLKLLAKVNRRVAARDRTVSPFCHVTFLGKCRERKESEVFVEEGESVPFEMPFLVGPIDLSGVLRRSNEQFLRVEKGEPEEELDAAELNEELKRRP